MGKNYFVSFLVLAFGLCFNFTASAQIVAVNDVATVPNDGSTSVIIDNVLWNDTLNGQPIAPSSVTVTQLSGPGGFLLTEEGMLIYTGGIQNGAYTIMYSICETANPNNCATASIFVTVYCPNVQAPIIASVTQPTCLNPIGEIFVIWAAPAILFYSVNGGALTPVQGAGSTTIVTPPLTSGEMVYDFYVGFDPQSFCSSQHVTVVINSVGGLSLGLQGIYEDYNANGVTDVGDVINYQFTVTNDSCDTITGISAGANTTLPILGYIPFIDSGQTDSTTLTSTYPLTQNDINAGFVTKYVYIYGTAGLTQIGTQASTTTQLSVNDGISLVAFVDANANGSKDTGEVNFNNGSFNYEINNDGTVHHIASNQPFYLFETNPATSYDLSYTVNSAIAAYYTTGTVYNDVTVANGSGVTTYYFPITAIPYTDLSVILYSYGAPPRPGFTYPNWIHYTNSGNQPIASGTVSFTADSVLTITSISELGTTPTANGFTYNFTNLLPGETRILRVDMLVPVIPTVSLGQLLTNTASVSIPTGDVNTNNNFSPLTHTIVGSWDPNEKSESHGGRVLYSGFSADDYLTYTIQFENTGTADAINVKVTDVLDAKLDETSVKMLRASHTYTLDRVGNALTWNFNGIDLPPSVPNTMTGHGYIVFQVKPKPGFALGDVIPNIANIYFDFNPAIETNPCVTQFVNSLATDQFAFDNFNYYPNPVKNVLTISNDKPIDAAVITSVLGQEVLSEKVNDLKAEIDLSGLSNGVYFVKVSSDEQIKTIKIIKE